MVVSTHLALLQRATAFASFGPYCRLELCSGDLRIIGGDPGRALASAVLSIPEDSPRQQQAAAITVPAKLLRDSVAPLRGDSATVTLARDLTIQTPSSRMTLQPGGLVPRFPDVSAAQSSDLAEAQCSDLFAALEHVGAAACNDASRENVWGVRWDGADLAATDGCRVHSAALSWTCPAAAAVTVDPAGCGQLAALLADFCAMRARMHQDARKRLAKGVVAPLAQKSIVARMAAFPGWIAVEVREQGGDGRDVCLTAAARSRAAPYADWRRVVAGTTAGTCCLVTVDAATLAAALKLPADDVLLRVDTIAGTLGIEYVVSDQRVRLGCGSSQVPLASAPAGDPALGSARVSRRYLLDALPRAGAVELQLRGQDAPLYLSGGPLQALVMFVR